MQVTFSRWSIDRHSRHPVSVNPKRVDSVEFFSHATPGNDVTEAMPAATKILMQGKQVYLVQGTVAQVAAALNNAEQPSE